MGITEWKITKRKYQSGENSGETDLTGLLLKAGQGDQTSPGGWWGVRNLIGYRE